MDFIYGKITTIAAVLWLLFHINANLNSCQPFLIQLHECVHENKNSHKLSKGNKNNNFCKPQGLFILTEQSIKEKKKH